MNVVYVMYSRTTSTTHKIEKNKRTRICVVEINFDFLSLVSNSKYISVEGFIMRVELQDI